MNGRDNLTFNILNICFTKIRILHVLTRIQIGQLKYLNFVTQIQDVSVDDATSQTQNREVEASSPITGESSVFTISLYILNFVMQLNVIVLW